MIILVTGSTDGIGREAARQLGARGHHVLVHGRSRDKAERAAGELAGETGKRDAFEAVAGDFASLEEVRALAAEVARRHTKLDVLVNNAGIYARGAATSKDGWELTLAVNQLAPFALTHLLLGALDGGRVVFVSSNVHRSASDIDFPAIDAYEGYEAYAVSKLMNVLTALELARRLDGRVAVNAMHPGVIGTKLLRQGFGAGGGGDVARGAAGEVKLATDPALDVVTGRYYDMTEESRPSPLAKDAALQRRCYDFCLERTSVAPA